jgi:hypothetical protein
VSPSPVPATPAALLDKPVSTLATARSPAVLCLNRVPPISGAAESGPAATDAPRSPAYALPNGRDPAASLPHRASAAPKPALVAKCVTAGTKFLNYSTMRPCPLSMCLCVCLSRVCGAMGGRGGAGHSRQRWRRQASPLPRASGCLRGLRGGTTARSGGPAGLCATLSTAARMRRHQDVPWYGG